MRLMATVKTGYKTRFRNPREALELNTIVLEECHTVQVLSEIIRFGIDFNTLIVRKQGRYLRIVARQ